MDTSTSAPYQRPRRVAAAPTTVRTGRPHPGGRLEYFGRSDTDPVFDGQWVYLPVQGVKHRRAALHRHDFFRLTRRDPTGPFLDARRVYMDDMGLLRAPSHRDGKDAPGVLLSAAILCADEGDTIEVPSDPFDLRLRGLKKLETAHV